MVNEEKSEKKVETNEFDNLDIDEVAPESEFSEIPTDQNDLIGAGVAGVKYDWSKAPEGVKAPPRIDMNGKELVLKGADLILPPKMTLWDKTKAGDKEFKYVTFVLLYDFEGQQEYYSGVRVFKKEDDKYSHPTITRDRNNQASRLLGIYADYKGKDINEVSLREFLAFLNSKPHVLIKSETVINPINKEEISKNFVGKFISG